MVFGVLKKLLFVLLGLMVTLTPAFAQRTKFSNQSVPTTMIAGQRYNVAMNFFSADGWLAEDKCAIGPVNPINNMTWGIARSTTSGFPGQLMAFVFDVVAPSTPGVYNFQWQVNCGNSWIGEPSTNLAINVVAPTKTMVSIDSPADGQHYTSSGAGISTWVTGHATPRAGTSVVKVDLLAGTKVIGSTSAIDKTTFGVGGGLNDGENSIQVRATDSSGGVALSPAITVYGHSNSSVGSLITALTYPKNNATFLAPEGGTADVPVVATASTDGNTINLMYVYDGDRPVRLLGGNVASAIVKLPIGVHTLRSQVSNEKYNVFSDPITVKVTSANILPTATLSTPNTNTVYVVENGATAAVNVTGWAADIDGGTIQTLELLDNGVVRASTSGPQFAADVQLPVGTHLLQLRPIDNSGGVGLLSNAISVTVLPSGEYISYSVMGQTSPGGAVDPGGTFQAGLYVRATVSPYRLPEDAVDAVMSAELREGNIVLEKQQFRVEIGSDGRLKNSTRSMTLLSNFAVGVHKVYMRLYTYYPKVYYDTLAYTITVVDKTLPPVVVFSTPSNGSTILSPNALYGQVPIVGSASTASGTVARLELVQDGNVIERAVGPAMNTTVSLRVGDYALRLRATDNNGLVGESKPLNFSVRQGALLGAVTEVRSGASGKTEVVGWVCQDNVSQALRVQVTANQPVNSPGGAVLGSGLANVSTEPGNSVVQAKCHSPGSAHHFVVELNQGADYYSEGRLIVQAQPNDGSAFQVLPCDAGACTLPGGLRLVLMSPADGSSYPSTPSKVTIRAKILNGSDPYDGVDVNIDGGWAPLAKDVDGTYAVTTSFDPATTHTIYARVRKGNVTLNSTRAQIYMGNVPPAKVTLSATPIKSRVTADEQTFVNFTGNSTESGHTVSKLELFQLGNGNNVDIRLAGNSGNSSTLDLNTAWPFSAGIYRFKLRSTNDLGVQTESAPVVVSITNSPLLGLVSGVRIDRDNKPQLYGWTCQPGVSQPLSLNIYLDAPSEASGGTLLGTGVANVSTEPDNAAVQAACQTPGAGHHFNIDLSAYSTQYPGRAIYVQGYVAGGGTDVVLPCAENSCTIPDSLRIALSVPANGQHYNGASSIFVKTVLSGGAGSYDEVAIGVDGIWTTANPDGAADAYSLTSASLPVRAAPYAIQARVRQGNSTIYSAVNMITVDPALEVQVTLSNPVSGASVASGGSMTLTATTSGNAAVASLKFYANGNSVATATRSGSTWSAVWSNIVSGSYQVKASAFDGSGALLAQTPAVAVTATAPNNGAEPPANSSDTPLAVKINTPHLINADAGTLPGELGINNAGAATYGMPIVVPPGTAGLQPSISLDYNSQGGNSIVGLGWSISGMSRIARCGMTIDQDGVNSRINFSLTDRLCLDGRRLVLVNLAMSDLNYWADTAEYRTEHDGFSRITAQGVTTGGNLAGRSFQVKSKDGRIMTYGGTASSVVKAIVQNINSDYTCSEATPCKPAEKNGPIGWALDSVKDRYGNYINYNYTQSATTGEHVLADIRYGGNGLAPHASVVFTSDTKRPDAWTRYIDDARNDLRSRVNNISTYVGDDLSADATAGTRIRSYTLTYERSPTSGRSLLNMINVAARNPQTEVDDALPVTTFSWGKPDTTKQAGFDAPVVFPGGPRLSQLTTYNPVGNQIHANLFAFADFENHGFTDILEKSVAPLDVPKTDLQLYADRSLKTSYRYYHNNAGKGYTEYRYTISTGEAFGVLDTADFNGDGAPDLLVSAGQGLKICLSPLGNGKAPGDVSVPIVFDCSANMPTTGSAAANETPYVADIRGDGRAGLYGRILYGSAPSTVCMQMACQEVPDPPGEIVGFGYAADGSPEFYRHDYSEYSAMVDYAGVGKPFDTRFTMPHFVSQLSYDDTPKEVRLWVNMTPTISILTVPEPGTTVSAAPMTGYRYRKYAPLGAAWPNVSARVPYSFDSNYPGMGRDGDFNGSGYSSLAYGFLEYSWDVASFTYGKAEMTLCLSTGRSLDCHVRKKYSGSTLAAFDGAGTPNRMQYLAVRGVGNFIGDGQPSILAESMVPNDVGPFPTTKLYMCRVMGDDVSTKEDGSDDSNIACDPWSRAKVLGEGTGDHTFFMDVLGTGRMQLVNYHEDWQASDPNNISYSWAVSKPTDLAVAGQALDRIYAVTNGMRDALKSDPPATATVTYTDGLVDGTVTHSGTLALAYPQHLSSGVGKYATTLSTANGGSGNLVRTYRFQDPVIDVNGRGSLGFAHVTIKDEQSQVQTDTDFGIKWPLTGMVRKEVVSHGGTTLSQTDNTLALTMLAQANGGHTWFPAVVNSVVQRWDLSGAEMGTTTTSGLTGGDSSIAYDTYGNVLSSRVVVSGANPDFAHTTDTVNTYTTTDTERLYLGLPDSVTVTKSHNGDGGTAVARKVAMEYESSGKIKSQTVEPDAPALKLKTSFTYDSTFGVLLTKQLNWFDPDTAKEISRVEATMTYDAKARFPATVKNALEHLETHAYNAGTGARTKLTGPNGLSTVWEVNGFGRVTRELRADGNASQSYMKQCASDCLGSEVAVAITEQFHGVDRIAVPQVAYLDNMGRVVRALTWGFDGSKITTNKTYDAAGLPLDEDMPHYGNSGVPAVHREYDALRRPILLRTFGEDGGNVDTATDYDGLKVTLTNGKGQVRVEHKDVLGLTSYVENLLTTPTKKTLTTRFGYDAWGNLATTIDPNKNVITVKYDTLGRKIQLQDPDLGQIDYSVNPLGLTWKQVSPVQRAKAALPTPPPAPYTKMKFDALNRMVERTEDDLKSYWIYDTAANGIGQLAQAYTGVQASPDYRRVHTYDDRGRPLSTTQTLFDGDYVSTPKYDAWGRVVTVSYGHAKDALKVFAQRYNNYGYLSRMEREGLVLWKATGQDASHRVASATLGNGLVQTDDYNAHSGRLAGSATTAGTVERLKESYIFDKIGNVSQRTQHWEKAGFMELFEYDELNRLTKSTIGSDKVFTYDDAGNLTSKTDVGTGDYIYPPQGAGAVRPHAVLSITGKAGSFSYDNNGNLLSDPWHTATWNNFDMPIRITKGGKSSTFVYGAEHQRTRQTREDGTMTVYGGAQEVELDSQGKLASVKTYWPMGLGVEIDKANATATELHWLHRDRLGSPVAISGETGVVQEQLAYDAWGKRRIPDGSATPDNLDGVIDNKGYTGHEMLDQVDLVHMNGRVYDPLVARFISADPIIQDPFNGQSFNRYSYVLNNPTNLTDPTGFVAVCDDKKVCAPEPEPQKVTITGQKEKKVEPPQPKVSAKNASVAILGLTTITHPAGRVAVPAAVTAFIAAPLPAKIAVVAAAVVGYKVWKGNKDKRANAIANGDTTPSDALSNKPDGTNSEGKKGDREGNGFPDRELPRDPNGNPVRDPEAEGAHTQLGQKEGRRGKYDQGREWDANGRPVKDIDFTDHGRPQNHTNPHEHPYLPNPTGGTPQHGPARPLQN